MDSDSIKSYFRYVDKESIINLNLMKLTPLVAFKDRLMVLFNVQYCRQKPFTTYFQSIQMDSQKTAEVKLVKKVAILAPLYLIYDYHITKLTDHENPKLKSITSFAVWHSIATIALPYACISLLYSINARPFLISKSYNKSKCIFLLLALLQYNLIVRYVDASADYIIKQLPN